MRGNRREQTAMPLAAENVKGNRREQTAMPLGAENVKGNQREQAARQLAAENVQRNRREQTAMPLGAENAKGNQHDQTEPLGAENAKENRREQTAMPLSAENAKGNRREQAARPLAAENVQGNQREQTAMPLGAENVKANQREQAARQLAAENVQRNRREKAATPLRAEMAMEPRLQKTAMPFSGERVGVAPVVGALLLFLAACTDAASVPPTEASPPERWSAVRPAGQAAVLEVPARVVPGPTSTALVSVPLRATVMRVRVRAGDVVDAGAPLIDVVMPEVLDAAGRLEGARVRLDAWTERHTQLAALRADGLAKSVEVSEAAARVAEAKADVHGARAVLLAAGLRDETGAALLAGAGVTSLRAPFAGVVAAVAASLGESRDPTSGPLVTIVGAGATRIEARFSRPLAVSDEGGFTFVGVDGTTPLRLVSRSPAADARDGTFLVWFEADAPLVAASLGRVLVRGAASDAFLVPATAIERVEGRARVTTRRGPQGVEVLRCEAADCVVRGELQPADEVTTARPRGSEAP